MKQLEQTYTLSNGVQIPKLGLGTWFIPDELAAEAVRTAVELGNRHIDTAQAYGNERGVGEGVRTCGHARKELFVTTKLAAEAKSYAEAAAAIDGSLKLSGLDYFDLMLIHSPQPWADFRGGDYSEGNREAWRALEDAQGRKAPGNRRFQLQRAGFGEYPYVLYGRAHGEPAAHPHRQHALRAD